MNESKEKATYKIILKDKNLKLTIEGTYSETLRKIVEILVGIINQ